VASLVHYEYRTLQLLFNGMTSDTSMGNQPYGPTPV
jgi:hypothetical protein